MACRWECPHYWLYDRMARAIREDDCDWLEGAIRSMADSLGHDTLQDTFGRDMAADGYFDGMYICPWARDGHCAAGNPCPHGRPHTAEASCHAGFGDCPPCDRYGEE